MYVHTILHYTLDCTWNICTERRYMRTYVHMYACMYIHVRTYVYRCCLMQIYKMTATPLMQK